MSTTVGAPLRGQTGASAGWRIEACHNAIEVFRIILALRLIGSILDRMALLIQLQRNHSSREMVNDNRQILMSLTVAALVYPNHPQAIELALFVSPRQ